MRVACVFLPHWPPERLQTLERRDAPSAPPEGVRPRVLVMTGTGGIRVASADRAAAALGLRAGMLLADAQVRVPTLGVADADPEGDRRALRRLARWCQKFSPWVAPWESDAHGLTLDITGCAQLYGGEEELARTIHAGLAKLGYEAHVALADTQGAAHALARWGSRNLRVVPPGQQRAALGDLPVESLRIGEERAALLRRLGLARVGDLYGKPRRPLAARFGRALIDRLAQALGEAPEPISPLAPHVPYRVRAVLAEPVMRAEHVETLIARLARDLETVLARDAKGACVLVLTLFRVDGRTVRLPLRLTRPSRDAGHIAKLFALRLERLASALDAGFGYDAALLEAREAETLAPRQIETTENAPSRDLEPLIDRLGTRLGVANVTRAHANDTHIPERAVVFRPAAEGPSPPWEEESVFFHRPLFLLPAPEPAEVLALLPEGAPKHFRWRGVRHTVAQAEGPERLRPEWWERKTVAGTRDYYVVEDEEGRRFWMYRAFRRGVAEPPSWFLHGVFP